MKTENLFSDETLLSDLGEQIPMESDSFDFLNMSLGSDFDDSNIIDSLPATNVTMMQTQSHPQVVQQVQQEAVQPVQAQPQRIAVAPAAPTVFSSQYAIPQTMNFNVQSPVVTLAPVTTQQRQLLLPAKLIKSESVVYSRGSSQSVTSTPVSHQIHTLVNTSNGTLLATGKSKQNNVVYICIFRGIYSGICNYYAGFLIKFSTFLNFYVRFFKGLRDYRVLKRKKAHLL